MPSRIHQTIYLADTPNHFLCGAALSSAAAARVDRGGQRARGARETWVARNTCGARQYQSAGGQHYLFLLSRPRTANTYGLRDLLHFAFPQLPVAIVVFGVTTFILVLLLVRPIGKLRVAARKSGQRRAGHARC